MPRLYFRVESDWEKVVKLREEISKLESQIKTMDANKAPHAVAALNKQVIQSQKQLKGMVSDAAKAAVIMDGDFKTKIYSGSQAVNEYTKRVISAKDRLRELQTEYRRLSGRHTELGKNTYQGIAIKKQMDGVSNSMAMAKDKLFALSQEQSKARLSVKQLKDEYALYDTQVKDTTSSTFSLGKAFGVIGGVAVLKRLGSEIINVRGQFRAMEISLETMVGENKAKALLADIKQYAAISPLGLKEVQASTEMMIGFNVEAEKVPRFIQAIGDISRGENQKFQSLSLAFSQMSAAGKLMGQDLNQMINAGFNPLQIISEKTGKSMAQLRDEMSKGAISAETVQQAFIDATSAGGKFYGMSEKQSQEVAGQMAILSDTISNKLNEIGESNEGLIKSGIGVATSLVNNYETIGRVIAGLIATYGTYRTALMLNAALELGSTKAVWEKIKATQAVTVAQDAYNKVLKMNPYIAVGAAVVTLGIALWTLTDHTSAAEKAQKRFNETSAASKKQLDELRSSAESLISIIKSETSTQYDKTKAYKELQNLMPTVFSNMDIEKLKLMDHLSLNKQISEEINRRERVVAKTNAVLAQRELDKAKRLASGSAGMYSNGQDILNQQRIQEAEETLRLANKAVEDIEKLQAEANKPKETGIETKNKSYWEKKKQEAEASRNALGVEKNNSKEWAKYTDQIRTAQKNIDLYSDSKTAKQESAAEKKAKKQKENQEKLNESLLSLQRQNQQDEANLLEEGTAKKLAQIKADFDAQDQAIKKKAKDFAKINKEASVKGVNADGLTTEQQSEIDKANKLNSDNQVKQEGEVYKAELESMRGYLKEYGTFQQQKLAIAEEYAEKIRKAQGEGERLTLEKQRDSAIRNVDNKAISQNIDWQIAFGNLAGILDSQLKETFEGLKEYVKTDEFKRAPNTDKQIIYEAIERLREVVPTGEGTLDFSLIKSQMDKLGEAINAHQAATFTQTLAQDNLTKATENYNKALKSGDESQIKSTKTTLDIAKKAKVNADKAYDDTKDKMQNIGQEFKDTASETVSGLNLVGEGFRGFASKSLPEIFRGLQNTVAGLAKLDIKGKVGDAISSFSKAISNAGVVGQIIGAVLSILDVLKDGIGPLISGIIDTILGAINGIIKNIISGKMFVQIFSSIRDGIGNLLNTITFGGFGSWTDGNAKETADKIAQLTSSNDALKVSIDALKDEIKGSNGSKSISAYNEARDAQKRYEENLRQILDAQMGYHSSHHSNSYYWNLNKNSLSQVNSLLGTSLGNSWGDFSKLTADQMNEIRKHLPDIWSEMIDQGKYGDRFKDDWNNYADQAGKVLEMTDNLRESLTQISFDSLRDSFVDSLMDMDKKASDFASDFQKYMTKALLDFAIGDLLDDEMKEWYESWADTMNKQDGKLTDKQVDDYAKWWDDMVNKGLAKRDEIAKLTGYTGDSSSSSQSASSKGYQTMSQDTGEELKGRFTALQAAGEEIKRLNMEQTMSLKEFAARAGEILTVNSDIRNIADDTRNILASTYLETVEIKENTGAIIKPIKSMAADIAEVKQNTKGLSSR